MLLFIQILSVLFLALFIVFSLKAWNNTKRISYFFFSAYLFAALGWGISAMIFSNTSSYEVFILTAKLSFVFSLFTTPVMLLFAFTFPDEKQNRFLKIIAGLIVTTSIIFSLISLFTTNVVTSGVIEETKLLYGSFHKLVSYYILLSTVLIIIIFIRKIFTLEGVYKRQIIVVLLSNIFAASLAIFTNLLLPQILDSSKYSGLGVMSTLPASLGIIIATRQHKFLDIRILIGRISYFILMGGFSYMTFYVVAFIDKQFFGGLYTTGAYMMGILNSILFILFYDKTKKYVQENIDSKLINPGYDPKDVINNLNNNLSTVLDYNEIAQKTIESIAKTIRPNYEGLLITLDGETFQIIEGKVTKSINTEEMEKAVFYCNNVTKKEIILNDLNGEIPQEFQYTEHWLDDITAEMKKQKLEALIPLGPEKEVFGLILVGKKEADSPYTRREVNFLNNIAGSASAALYRSFLYFEVQDLNKNLQGKVERATGDLKLKNEELEMALKKLEELRRQEKDMIDVMGHELRTPITIVRNALTQLVEWRKKKINLDDTKVDQYVEMALEGIRREISLVEALLSATKVEAGRMEIAREKINMGEIISITLKSHEKMAADKQIALRYKKPAQEQFIFADKIRVQEVINNLVSNAVKYTGKGFVEVTVQEDGDVIKTSIRDTGIGISKEDIKKLGKKFFRAKQYTSDKKEGIVRPGGTGLGLFVVVGLIKAMDGEVIVEGIPSDVAKSEKSYTGQWLKKYI